MTDGTTIGIIVAGTTLATAVFGLVLNTWISAKNATSVDARLGLDALVAGVAAATTMAEQLHAKLKTTETKITQIERIAGQVLTENNEFRRHHGIPPVHSLEVFEPLDPHTFHHFVNRSRGDT